MSEKKQFLDFYEKYKDKIYVYFWYRVGFNRPVAEDLTSEVFLKALRNFDSYDQSRSFQAWIYTIAKNHLADYHQKCGREICLEFLPDVGSNANDVIDEIDNKKEANQIISKMKELKKYHREVLLMRYVDGLSNQEITRILNKEEGAVRAQISRAMCELRKKLSFFK